MITISQMDLYEVLEPSSAVTSGSYRLIARRPVSSYGHGWEVFNVTEVVHQWSSNGSDVHGRYLTIITSGLVQEIPHCA